MRSDKSVKVTGICVIGRGGDCDDGCQMCKQSSFQDNLLYPAETNTKVHSHVGPRHDQSEQTLHMDVRRQKRPQMNSVTNKSCIKIEWRSFKPCVVTRESHYAER
jgi:hypothetical protein